MQKKLTINLDSELLSYTAQCFGYQDTQTDYSELIEKVLVYFLKPQLDFKSVHTEDKKIQELLIEPVIDIDTIEKELSL